MTFPTIPTVGAGRVLSSLNLNPAGTHTFPNLSSLTKNAGDLLIAIVIIYDGNSTNAEFSSWGGGFTEFADQAGTATMGIGCAYKWSTGSETGTFTVTSADTSANDSACFLLSIPGAHASTPPEAGTMATGTSAAADPGALDPAGWGAEDTLWIAVGGSGETSTTGSFTGIASAPANYTDYADSGISADVVGGVEGAVAFRQLNASSENVGAFSVDVSNARNAALLIAVRPAPSPVLATLDQTLGDLTLSSTAELDLAATLAQTLGDLSLAATGELDIAATLAQTLGDLSLSSTLELDGGDIEATLDQTLGVLTLNSTAEIDIAATLAQTLGALTLGSTAALDIAADVTQTLGALTLNSTATVRVTAVVAQTLDSLSLTSTAALRIAATTAQTLGALSLSATADLEGPVIADLNQTLGALTLSATLDLEGDEPAVVPAPSGGEWPLSPLFPPQRRRKPPLREVARREPLRFKVIKARVDVTLGAMTVNATAEVNSPRLRRRRAALAVLFS